MSPPPVTDAPVLPRGSAFLGGLRAGETSVFMVVIVGSYVSIGALAHDLGFPLLWIVLSSLLIWAAPAQLILISALGAGAPPLEVALAVGLSGMRLLPMVVALMPLLKTPATRARDLIVPAHFTAISMWIESLRLLPKLPRAARIPFAHGLGTALMAGAPVASDVPLPRPPVPPRPVRRPPSFLSPPSFPYLSRFPSPHL